MPDYPWFYEDDGLTPNKKGLSIIAYVQWLGSWDAPLEETLYNLPYIEESFPATDVQAPAKPGGPEEPAAEEGEEDFWGEEE